MSFDDSDERDEEEPFHPLGESWQDGLEDALEDTEYDAELGMEMAKDAMRVTEGELSEEEFYDRYHDDVVEEFGEDSRPMADEIEAAREEDGRFEETLSRFGVGEDSRRNVMKKMGGVGAVGLGAWGATNSGGTDSAFLQDEDQEADEPDDTNGEGVQWGMALDLEHCDGCLSCVVACAEEHDWDQGANWMYVLAYEDDTVSSPDADDFESTEDFEYLIRPCQHCTDAPCEKVCPTTARHTRDSDGLVLTDYDVCIGCRYCQVACPYGVNYFQWENPEVGDDELDEDHVYDERDRPVSARGPRGVMEKCTFCPTRQDGNLGDEMVGTTACEDACPPEVIQFGNMNDPNSDPQRYIENTAKSRTLVRTAGDLPSPEDLEEALDGEDDDLESIVDAVEDLDEEMIGNLLAIAILSDEEQLETEENSSLVEQEADALELVEVLVDHGLDLEDEELLIELDFAEEPDDDEEFEGASEALAQERLDTFAGDPDSKFKLLEGIGTDPNVVYLGNEPGPNAHQVEGPVSYADVGQTDDRKDVLDEGTVGIDGPSL
ncbi:4Fe-4S ferredoxin N-terminal domain-containing protein [Natronorubrum texcoconense]|uniref:Prokaryotic molybdopterin-containing oxidoreductase family, iron-sulfur binding subunit n=1 Tax=Natronorubrum texcoconense TaxID=1095776 RepID=A0A1G8UWQ5_9EURY|nr:4Fe-4S ferredoxin N-terminal domain-containing protein [Natronorubrum texcoconense]SDJ58074.1 prokaryotic molybdopterin-containing oxidoreductase family, iron-sulfur binding subunit [Natronorubrum texcoconense]